MQSLNLTLRLSLVGAVGASLLVTPVVSGWAAAQAQTAAVEIGQRFTWEPIARIENPSFPVQISLVNRTGVDLNYGFTDNPEASPAILAPDGQTTLTLASPDILLSINPIQSNAEGDTPLLQFDVTVQANNAIQVVLKPGGNLDQVGDAIGQVLDIQESGGIFVY